MLDAVVVVGTHRRLGDRPLVVEKRRGAGRPEAVEDGRREVRPARPRVEVQVQELLKGRVEKRERLEGLDADARVGERLTPSEPRRQDLLVDEPPREEPPHEEALVHAEIREDPPLVEEREGRPVRVPLEKPHEVPRARKHLLADEVVAAAHRVHDALAGPRDRPRPA